MNIACWNCHNLNSYPKRKTGEENCSNLNSNPKRETCKGENRRNYLELLQKRFDLLENGKDSSNEKKLDVIFLSEVEEQFEGVPLACSVFTKFVPCKQLDDGWNLSSGILLYHAPDVSLDPYELLPVPNADEEDPGSKYGFAIKTKLKKGNESVDAVFFWNTKRKKSPSHGPGATFNFLLDRLLDKNFFAAKSWFIAGDFNLTYGEVDSRCRKKIRNGYTLLGRTNTYFRSFKNQNYCSDLDHLVSSSGTAEMISINGLSRSDFVGKGLSDHLPIIFKTR